MNHHGDRTSVFAKKAISLRAIVPLSFLVLTCCMAQVEAGTRPQPEDAKSPQLTRASEQPAQSPISAPQPNTLTVASNVSDPVQEGRMLFGKTPSESGAKKSKGKGKVPAKRLDTSAEEEEDEEEAEDEEADDEATTSTGSAKGGTAIGSRLKSIQSDFDPALRANLVEATVRGSVLTVVVSLTLQGNKDLSELVVKDLGYCGGSYTWVTDYESGTTFRCMTTSGFKDGEIKSGETKNLRLTFEVPKEAKNTKAVGITLYHLGTFDDVKFGSSGGSLSGQRTGSSKTEDIEEEDEEDEEDVEEEDSKGLTKKKGAKKAAKKGAKKGAK